MEALKGTLFTHIHYPTNHSLIVMRSDNDRCSNDMFGHLSPIKNHLFLLARLFRFLFAELFFSLESNSTANSSFKRVFGVELLLLVFLLFL